MHARLKIWIDHNDAIVLSAWRIRLLCEIDRTGSLSRAAEALDVPYRTAWQKLKQMESRLDVRLVASRSGGSDGGRTELTPVARLLIDRYGSFIAGLQHEVDRRFATSFADLMTGDQIAIAAEQAAGAALAE